MSASANKQIVQTFFDALAAGDIEKMKSVMARDFTWTFPGSTAISGTFRGHEEIFERFLPKVAEYVDMSAGLGIHIDQVIAEGDTVVVRYRGEMTGKFGPYNNRYCHVLTVRDGLIRGTEEYADTALVETALFGKKLE
ncbi:MAG: nuclear transport factor 2 family protein [Myxococcales bacterium]|nr:nuclear transport factor 2 family protein [Myxococcales bacterium]